MTRTLNGALLSLLLVVAMACGSTEPTVGTEVPLPSTGGPETAEAPSVEPSATAVAGVDEEVGLVVVARFALGRVSQRLRTDGDVLFVQQPPGAVARIDPTDGSAVRRVTWSEMPGQLPSDMAFGGLGFVDGVPVVADAAQVGDAFDLIFLDPATLAPTGVATAPDDERVLFPSPRADATLVSVIDRAALAERVGDELVIAVESPGLGPLVRPVQVGDVLWALAPESGLAVGFGPDMAVPLLHEVPVVAPTWLTFGHDSLWTGSGASGEVFRIDPVEGVVTGTIAIEGPQVTQTVVHAAPGHIVATSLLSQPDGPSTWILSLIDPASNTVADRLDLGTDPDLAPTLAVIGETVYVVVDGVELLAVEVSASVPAGPIVPLGLDLDDDERFIVHLAESALDYTRPYDPAAVVNGAALEEVGQAAIDAAHALGRQNAVVTGVARSGDTGLAVVDIVDEAGTPLLSGALVTLRRVGQEWRIDDAWVCRAVVEFGLSCPP